MGKFISTTFVIGATDETNALQQTVEDIFRLCNTEDVGKVLIVYSKNASDGCKDIIRESEIKYPDVVFGLEQTRPFVGGAIRDGFDTAETSHITLLPGDLAISMDAVPKMLELAKNNPDCIVKTSRWMEKNSFHGYNKTRLIFNKLAQMFLQLLFFTKATDLTQPVQTMPTNLYKLINFRELNFPFLLELAVIPVKLGTKIIEIPAKCYGRTEGKSKNSAKQTALYLKTALKIRFSPKSKLLK